MKFSEREKNRLKHKYGPWAIITGATSGIGLELAERLAECGLNLIINARHQEGLNETERLLRLKYTVDIRTVAADVAEPAGIDNIIQAARDVEVGLVVVSAGFGSSGLFIDSSVHTEINMLRVNCEALLVLTHHYCQQFCQRKRGGIILMSSMVAFQGVPWSAHYAATKAYVQSLAEALAIECKPYGVDVLAAAPGPVATGFAARSNLKMSMSLTPAQVGGPILKALGRKSTVLPGRLTKLLVFALRTVPRWGKVRIMAKVMGGMTAHQRQ